MTVATKRGSSGRAGRPARLPSYAELGKECKELFSKGYQPGLFKIDVHTFTCDGIEIATSGEHKAEDKSAKAEVEFKSAFNRLSTSTKWDTNHTIATEVSLQDLFPGGKITAEGRLNSDSGNLGGALKYHQKHPIVVLDAKIDSGNEDDPNATVSGSVVTGINGLRVGYQVDYDPYSETLKTNNMAAAYQNRRCTLLLGYENLNIISGSYFHKISKRLQVGCQGKVGGDGDEASPQFAIAGKFIFSKYCHTVRAKINNQSILGLGLELGIRRGFSASASGEIDLKNFSAGNHKIGFGLNFNST